MGAVMEVRLGKETKTAGCKDCQVAVMNAPQ